MDIPVILQLVGNALSTSGIAYGIFEQNKRQKMENVLKSMT